MEEINNKLIKQLHELVTKFCHEHSLSEAEFLSYISSTLVITLLKLKYSREDVKNAFEMMYKSFLKAKEFMND